MLMMLQGAEPARTYVEQVEDRMLSEVVLLVVGLFAALVVVALVVNWLKGRRK